MVAVLVVLKVIYFRIFFLEVIGVVRGVKLFTECFTEESGGCFQTTVLPNAVTIPLIDRSESAFLQALFNVNCFLHLVEQMCAVGTSESVGGEITDSAARPMAILKHAALVIGNVDTQIFLVKSVPFCGKVLDCKLI